MHKSAESAKRSHYFFLAGSRTTRIFLIFLLFYTSSAETHGIKIPARMRRPGAIRPGRYLRPSLGGYPNCFLYTRLK